MCHVVKGLKQAQLGAIGSRPNAFNTVRYSENILQEHGISVQTIDLSEIAEQDAEYVFQCGQQCRKEIIIILRHNDPPTAMVLSCQGEAVIPVDRDGKALRFAILGMDTRTVHENA